MRHAALAALVATGACGDAPPGEPVKVGLLMPITGDLAARGRYFIDSALLVADEINSGGGLLGGRDLSLEVKDTGTSPAGAMTGFTELLGDGVAAIIGPASSAEAIALRLQIRTGDTLVIGPSTSSSALTTADFGGNFYRLVAPDAVQSSVLAELIDAAQLTKLCLVARNDVYGNGIADGVMAKLTAPPALMAKASYDPAQTDLSHVLDPCGMPDRSPGARNGILFASLIADGAAVMDVASTSYGWTAQDRVFLTDGTHNTSLTTLLTNPGFVDGATGTRARGPDPTTPEGAELAAFQLAFREKFNRDPDVYSEMAYDAAYVIAMALEVAGGSDDIAAVQAALPELATGTELGGGDWAAIAAELHRVGHVDYRGASGAVTLAPPSPDTRGPYFIEVWTFAGGQIEPVMLRTITP